jgi:hypothetical protein
MVADPLTKGLTPKTFKVRNYQFSQKLKLLGYDKFNHLINILTLPLTCGLRLPLNEWGPTREIFNFLNGR